MSLAATLQWDVRTTGNDANGGAFDSGVTSPGTDFSIQDSPQIAFTDLAIDASDSTHLTSAGNPFTSAHVGNVVNITSGTGFTAGRYTVLSVASNVATMDRSVGSTSSTGGHGNLGGGLLTIAAALTPAVAGNIIHVQVGTYTITSALSLPAFYITLRGYSVAHNDYAGQPQVTSSSSDVVSCASGCKAVLDNIFFNGAATNHSCIFCSSGTANLYLLNCKISSAGYGGIEGDGTLGIGIFTVIYAFNCYFLSCGATQSKYAIGSGGTAIVVKHCYFKSNYMDIASFPGLKVLCVDDCVFNGATINAIHNTAGAVLAIDHSVGYNTTSDCWNNAGSDLCMSNCILYGNPSFSLVSNSGSTIGNFEANAFGGNTHDHPNVAAGPGEVTLSASPFTSAGTDDFTLNGTAGGGADLKGVSRPASPLMGSDHKDIGALQTLGGGATYVIAPVIKRFVTEE